MVQKTGDKLTQTIRRQLKKVEYFCMAENIPPNQSVHELRKLFKRLRALLKFYDSVMISEAKSLRRRIKQLGKQLSPLRDSCVNADLFEKELRGKNLVPERKMKEVSEELFSQNKALVGNSLKDHTICREALSFIAAIKFQLSETGSKGVSLSTIAKEVFQSYQIAFKIYEELPDEPSAEEVHTLRKKLKRLYYQLDYIRILHPVYFKRKSEQLGKINSQLGDDHDLYILLEEMYSKGFGFSAGELFIIKNQIEYQRELNRIKLEYRLKHFFSENVEEFDQKLELL